MNPVIRKGRDKTTGHSGFPPTLPIEGVSTVKVDGIPVVVKGNAFKPHRRKKKVHQGRAVGGGVVRVNGKPVQRKGDKLTCGDTSANGSSVVRCG
jgi:uncharacterized Zn-binding protein involved in type VI secretion